MSFYRWLFAHYYDAFMARYEEHVASRKRELFAGVGGTVVEIGPGTGANLRFLGPGSRWIGIEPNRHMHTALARRAREAAPSHQVSGDWSSAMARS